MKVYHSLADFVPPAYTVLTLGTFDGVHYGHQIIIKRLIEAAKQHSGESVILTFFPHPRMVLHPEDESLKVLNTIDEKVELLRQLGVDHLIIHPFTKEFSALSYQDFISEVLVEKLHVKKLVIGYDHRFGNNREGSIDLLRQIAPKMQFSVEEIPEQDVNMVAVSSTKVRNALSQGDVESATEYLGKPYQISGTVVEGNKLGRTIGYPTANMKIDAPYKLVPANGVYAVKVKVGEEELSGMLNIGVRPTVNGTNRTIEVNIFEFNRDIYGQQITIYLKHRIRDEVKFGSLDELKEQLKRDQQNATQLLAQN